MSAAMRSSYPQLFVVVRCRHMLDGHKDEVWRVCALSHETLPSATLQAATFADVPWALLAERWQCFRSQKLGTRTSLRSRAS